MSRTNLRWGLVRSLMAISLCTMAGCPLVLDPDGLLRIDPDFLPDPVDQLEVQASLENNPPTAVAGDNQAVTAGATVRLDGSDSTDPDGDRLIYEWRQVDGMDDLAIEFKPNPNGAIVTFDTPEDLESEVVVVVRLQVRDNFSASSDDVEVTISPGG